MAHPLSDRVLSGRYHLKDIIGEGAMATVFRALDLSRPDAREVAVKVMHPHLADDRTFSARFRREARTATLLNHPNSVSILEIGEDNRVHFIAMELVPGRDLRHVLSTETRLGEARSLRILMGIAEALAAAHQLGIIHRDLKPENVMLIPDAHAPDGERIKVLDFGIAKLMMSPVTTSHSNQLSDSPDSESNPITQSGVVVGTPAYMSPEQCRGAALDGRSDLYTCGILLFLLITGRRPFESPSPLELAGRQAFEPPPPPSRFLPTILPSIEALILKLLAKNPLDRPPSATAFLHELRDVLTLVQIRDGKTVPFPAPGADRAATTPLPAQHQPASHPPPAQHQPASHPPAQHQPASHPPPPLTGQPQQVSQSTPAGHTVIGAPTAHGNTNPPPANQPPQIADWPPATDLVGGIVLPKPHGAAAYVFGILLAISVGVGCGILLAQMV